jgi:hypothetical protein
MALEQTDAPVVMNISLRGFFLALGQRFERGLEWLIAHSSGEARVRRVRALQALSDAELAKRGLKRDEIVLFVFRDVCYL